MRSATPVLLLAAAALALVGCGDAAHTPTSAELRGTQFMATSAKGHAFVEGTPPMLDFRDGTVSATGGCNETRGSYAIRGGRLSLGKDAMQTMMGCGTPLEHQDAWLDDVLDARPSVTVGDHGNTLVLATRDQRITFGRQGPSGGPMPIEGPHWTATSLHQTGAFVAIEGPMAHPTLRIKGGHASFFTGCNAGTTTAKVTDRTVEFGTLVYGSKVCPGYVGRVERQMLELLHGPAQFTFSRRTLMLTRNGIGLDFDER